MSICVNYPFPCLQIHKIPCDSGRKFVILLSYLAPSQQFREIYFGLSVFLRLGLPIIVTAVGTTLLVIFLKRKSKVRNKVLSELTTSTTQGEHKGRQMDSLTTCLITVAVFYFILIMPGTILGIYDSIKVKSLLSGRSGSCKFKIALGVVLLLLLINSSVNFFIYYWKLSSFRKAVRKSICDCFIKRTSDQSSLVVQGTSHGL